MFYNQKARLTGFIVAIIASITLNSCQDHRLAPAPQTLPDAPFYALTSNNQLLALNVRATNMPTATVTIAGLPQGEQILAIDFRPATGQLYGVGSSSRLYIINPMTGASVALGTGPFSPALNGNVVALDFNPTVDRIRLITNMGQNLRLHPGHHAGSANPDPARRTCPDQRSVGRSHYGWCLYQ